MLWIALAAAAQLSVPEPIDFTKWFSPRDFPAHVKAEGGTRELVIREIVRPDGRIVGCEIAATSGDPKVDALTCELVHKRGRFLPARWSDGTPSFGVYRLAVIWTAKLRTGEGSAPDVELTLNRFPKGVHPPVFSQLMFTADEAGRPLDCVEEPPGLRFGVHNRGRTNPELVRAACNALIKNYTGQIVKDETGKPTRSVQNALVSFTVE